ncbi:hypothetical protein GIB67_041140 [Kingdonia uniflora]|uniref:Macro domain-containing protein n=1 Tax=Kingdonia uniflora TaxID=39325 RepID=A0A7J7LKJ8_9MAGN|nr:hypothetical protein GIB67_041140 [Kingdonia uniflora]
MASSAVCKGGAQIAKSLLSSRNPNPNFLKLPNFRNPNIKFTLEMSGNSNNCSIGASTRSNGGDQNHEILHFDLSPLSSLKIQKGDITQWFVNGTSDAIVNAANEKMLGGGGVDGAIHRAAGPQLREACYKVPEVRRGVRCPTGEARITPGFKLPVSHVIHTVGPIYDVDDHPAVSLRNAYRNCLGLAKEKGIQYVVFPAISCGIYGYPFEEAAQIAISTVAEFAGYFKEAHFVLFSDDIYDVWLQKAQEILQV